MDHFNCEQWMKPGTICVIAGRPGMGKTVVAVNLAKVLAKTKRVLYVYTDGDSFFDSSEFQFDFMHFSTIPEIMGQMHKITYDVVIVDSFQYLRNYSLKDSAYMLNWAAKKENASVIIMSNIPRNCERRKDKRPRNRDLKNKKVCGYLARYADEVMFLYRDAYYFTGKENMMEFIEYDKGLIQKRHIRKFLFEDMMKIVYPSEKD